MSATVEPTAQDLHIADLQGQDHASWYAYGRACHQLATTAEQRSELFDQALEATRALAAAERARKTVTPPAEDERC